MYMHVFIWLFLLFIVNVAHLAAAVEYTDSFSVEG